MGVKGFSIKGTAKTTGAIKPMSALVKEVDKLRGGVDKLDKKAKKTGDSLERFGEKAKDIRGKFGKLAIGTGAAVLAMDAVIDRSMRLQNVQNNLPFAIDKARKATKGLVEDFKLAQLAISANRLGVAKSEEDFARLAEAATKLGLSVGKDAASSVDDLVSGLGRGSTELLDNLGIQMRASEAYAAFAQRIGKTADELTDLEKKQAVMTIGLQKATEAADGVKIKVDETTKSWLELKTQLKNFADAVVPVIVGAFKTIGNEIKLAQDDLFNFMETVSGGQTALIGVRYDKDGNPIGMVAAGAGGGSRGVPLSEAGQMQRQREDLVRRRADAKLRAAAFGLMGRHAFTGKDKKRGPGGRGGRKADNRSDFEKALGLEAGAEGRFDSLAGDGDRGDIDALFSADDQRKLEQTQAFVDKQFEIERAAAERRAQAEEEEARRREEAQAKAFEKEKALAHMKMDLATTVSDTMISAGGAAMRAALMGGQGAREAVHAFALSKSIEMAILAATETARGIAALASPITAPLAPGHFKAAGQAAVAGALAGTLAGVTYGGGGGGRGAPGAGTPGGQVFAGGSSRREGRRAPSRGGPIGSRTGSSAIVQSQSASASAVGAGGNSYSFHFSGLGFADKDEIIGVTRRELQRHEQTYGSV